MTSKMYFRFKRPGFHHWSQMILKIKPILFFIYSAELTHIWIEENFKTPAFETSALASCVPKHGIHLGISILFCFDSVNSIN